MSILSVIHDKMVDMDTLLMRLAHWRLKNQKIVFTNGCFDLIHRGHIEYLALTANKGDRLVIGLNTDNSVKLNKGPNRPLNDENSRALALSALSFVDAVLLFDDKTPETIIEKIKPDVLAKGADYDKKSVVGANFVESYGGKVELIPMTEGYSTTALINKINET